jgi:SAM-dependent methyltransferase
MDLKELQKHWHQFGKQDPMWAILTWPDKKGNKWSVDEFFRHGRQEIDGVLEYVKGLGVDVQRGRALDFGCGIGRLTQAMALHFNEVAGVDIAPSMIKQATRYNRAGEKCTYYVNAREDLRLFADNSFDFIFTTIVLQHMRPSYALSYIKEFLRILVPRGILIFELPSDNLATAPPPQSAFRPGLPQPPSQGLGAKVRHLVKRVTPQSVLVLYRNVRYPVKQPIMEMYYTKRAEVERFLRDNGAQVLDVQEERMQSWLSCRYCVTKS